MMMSQGLSLSILRRQKTWGHVLMVISRVVHFFHLVGILAFVKQFIGRTDVEAETPILWPPHAKSWLIWKDPDAGKAWGQEKKGMTEDEMVGRHHRLNGHRFGWTPGVGVGQGGLVCCSSWGRKESDTTEWLNWTENSSGFAHQILLSRYFREELKQRIWGRELGSHRVLFSCICIQKAVGEGVLWMWVIPKG